MVRLAPKGATVTLSCRGRSCPFTKTRQRTVASDLAPVSFSSSFRRARLRSGSRLTLSITAPETIGRRYTYTVRKGALPDPRSSAARPVTQGVAVLRLARLAVALGLLLLTPAAASAGRSTSWARVILYDGEAGEDKIAAFETGDSVRFTRFGGASIGPGPGCQLADGGQSVVCDKSGVTTVLLDLGAGDDVAAISPALTMTVVFDGGAGDDGLFGGGGFDVFDGGSGNDNIVARDGNVEPISCGDRRRHGDLRRHRHRALVRVHRGRRRPRRRAPPRGLQRREPGDPARRR